LAIESFGILRSKKARTGIHPKNKNSYNMDTYKTRPV
jgi:hypothetical protein